MSNTSKPHLQHKVYSCLLKGLVVAHSDQVYSTDITSIWARQRLCLLDCGHRLAKVLAWQLSNTGRCRLLRGYATGGVGNSRCTRDFQHRSRKVGLPVVASTGLLQGCRECASAWTAKGERWTTALLSTYAQ